MVRFSVACEIENLSRIIMGAGFLWYYCVMFSGWQIFETLFAVSEVKKVGYMVLSWCL